MTEEQGKRMKVFMFRLIYILWYMFKTPFLSTYNIITNMGDSLRKPKFWFMVWASIVGLYLIYFWGEKYQTSHLIFFLVSFAIITTWWAWVTGDPWVEEGWKKMKGKV